MIRLFNHLQKKMPSTQRYFNLTKDELLESSSLHGADTLEEQLIMTYGSSYVFYDDLEDAAYWKDERKGKRVKAIVETLNGRIAYIMK